MRRRSGGGFGRPMGIDVAGRTLVPGLIDALILRDFPAVTLPALIDVALTAWAWGSSPRARREDPHAALAAKELHHPR
jgi:hypothetical protein